MVQNVGRLSCSCNNSRKFACTRNKSPYMRAHANCKRMHTWQFVSCACIFSYGFSNIRCQKSSRTEMRPSRCYTLVVSIIDSNGCFQGYPCVPSECEKCRTTLRDSAPANFLGQIHIMVQQGIITRPRFDLLCPACNHVNSWDPATELIHTIRNGAYGGNSWSKLFVL